MGMKLFKAEADLDGQAAVMQTLADVKFNAQNDEEGYDILEDILILYRENIDVKGEASALMTLAQMQMRKGQPKEAEKTAGEAAAAYEKAKDKDGVTAARKLFADA